MKAIIPEQFARGRLRYERIEEQHAADLQRLMAEPLVLRTLWPWAAPPSEADLRASLEARIEHWERQGFGLWALQDRSTGEFVGRGGLQFTDAGGVSAVEVAWAVMPRRWGEGLATELAHASIEVAFDGLELHELVALTLPDNFGSRRVMEKTGFAYRHEVVHAGLPHVLYARGRGHPPKPLLRSAPQNAGPL